jgi:flagellar hook assembly protein FlgD
MKHLIVGIGCVIILSCIVTCKKNTSSKPAPLCSTCSVAVVAHTTDSTGLYYFLPTGFTPDGSGIDNVYGLIYDSLNTVSSTLTIWNASGEGVYTGDITQSWDGTDQTGTKCPAGVYYVSMKLVTLKGQTITACTCVTILQYTGNCINTGGVTFYFADQLVPDSGFVDPTQERICP